MTFALELAKESSDSRLQEAIDSLFDDAAARILDQDETNTLTSSPKINARIAQEMLGLAEDRRYLYQSTQALLTIYIARNELWAHHPTGYNNLREFLADANLHSSVVSHLVSIGETILPYCDARGLTISNAMLPENFSKLRSAIGGINRAIRTDDVQEVREIIDLVSRAPNREVVRKKIQIHRERPGHGTTLRRGEDVILVVHFPEDGEHVRKAIEGISNVTQWDLVASFKGTKGLLLQVIPD